MGYSGAARRCGPRALLLVLGVAAVFSARADGGSADSACVTCHVSAITSLQAAMVGDRCSRCHQSHAESAEAPPAPALTDHPAIPMPPMPQYYETSRLGGEPNEMILVPAGPFTMGTDDRLPDEGPAHRVTLPAYYIDKFEVTNLQYKQFIDDTGRASPEHFENRTFPQGKADHPVTFVDWNDASAYCRWAGKRLPSDEEWEKAARGTDGRVFPWGNTFDVAKANTPQYWALLGVEGDTMPVGDFPDGASPYGLLDVSGNVWEWTGSWYEAYPGNTTDAENYGHTYRTLKGGSWWDCSFYKCGISAPTYNRSFFLPTTRNNSFGFRCAKDVQAEDQEEGS